MHGIGSPVRTVNVATVGIVAVILPGEKIVFIESVYLEFYLCKRIVSSAT